MDTAKMNSHVIRYYLNRLLVSMREQRKKADMHLVYNNGKILTKPKNDMDKCTP